MHKSKNRGLSAIEFLGIIVFGGIALLFMFAETESQKRERTEKEHNKAKTIESISDLSEKVSAVYDDKKENATEIVIKPKTILSDETVVLQLASESNDVAEGINKHFKNKITTKYVRFTLEVPLIDKYGNNSYQRVLAINFLTSDIGKINHSQGFTPQQLLNLYSEVWYLEPISRNLVAKFCFTEYGNTANVFCSKERKKES